MNVDEAMHAWLRACGNPTATEAAPAVVAGLLVPGEMHRYVATDAGRKWLVRNAIANGATRTEAVRGLDYLEGA